jgi:DNA-binding response OmpR family regulator
VTLNPSNQTILLVEDDNNDADLFEVAFQKASIPNPLQRVPDGEEAINYLAGTGRYADRAIYPFPILILLDLKLPRKTGFEVLSWIGSQTHLSGTIVLVRSSSCEPQDVKRAYQLGANAYLVKPHQMEELIETMRAIETFWLRCNYFCDELPPR